MLLEDQAVTVRVRGQDSLRSSQWPQEGFSGTGKYNVRVAGVWVSYPQALMVRRVEFTDRVRGGQMHTGSARGLKVGQCPGPIAWSSNWI